MSLLDIWVPGEPVAQGSMRSPKAGVVIHNSPSLSAWREAIGWYAKDVWRGKALIDEPVTLMCTFVLPPPKKPKHPIAASTALDLDKLIRAVGDALQGVVLKNDARIVQVAASKQWPNDYYAEVGARIQLWEFVGRKQWLT